MTNAHKICSHYVTYMKEIVHKCNRLSERDIKIITERKTANDSKIEYNKQNFKCNIYIICNAKIVISRLFLCKHVLI